ncbi:hypothetical protein ACFXGA_06315 [Actinosynnema sp. NPDC059335]|uniref:hypothetical protein n=1 Tax=Actinosynnema sp. NPDC059335 TaxID=3346804 RepID=UPI0036703A2C
MTDSTPPAVTPVAVLCGSVTRAVTALDAAERWYRGQGYTVHKPVRNDGVAFQLHVDRWYQLIDAADLVVVCTMQGDYVGEQTRREAERAFAADIPVHQWVESSPSPVGVEDTSSLLDQIISEYSHACPHCPADQPEWVVGEAEVRTIVERHHGDLVVRNAVLRSERDALARMLRGMARRAVSYRQGWSETLKDWAEEDQENVAALRARVSGAHTIPDDAAETVAKRLLQFQARVTPDRADRMWTRDLDDVDREGWLNHARALLADLGSTPATDPTPAPAELARWVRWLCDAYGPAEVAAAVQQTDPKPAAADGPQPKRSEWLCPNCKKPPTPFGDDQDWMCDEHKSASPAAPQAPAQPTVCPDCHETAPAHKTWCIKIVKPMTSSSAPTPPQAEEGETR